MAALLLLLNDLEFYGYHDTVFHRATSRGRAQQFMNELASIEELLLQKHSSHLHEMNQICKPQSHKVKKLYDGLLERHSGASWLGF